MKVLGIFRRISIGIVAALPFCALWGQQPDLPLHPQAERTQPWWKNAVIYEVYVRSFQDSDSDGVGDLRGLISRLDYLESLGIDAIWLTPIFPSPQNDFGYDVSNYCAIDPLFGTMSDMEELISEAKRRHIRVLLDLVLNHTSDQHPWFQASRFLRSPKRNWYIWRNGQPSSPTAPPNNWLDRTGDSAWQYDSASGQFYYHYFAKQQPDLNWRNPEVQRAMFDVVDFWLNKGVAGFRLDAVNMLFEDSLFRDEPKLPGTNEYGEPAQSQQYQRNLPEVHNVMKSLRKEVDRFPNDPVLIGEVYTANTQEVLSWYGKDGDELQLPMNTSLGFLNRRDAGQFRKRLLSMATLPDGDTPLLVFDNHDQRRSLDRYGDGQHNEQIAKAIATILLATRGSALMYQGQEIGMKTSPPKRREDVRDPRGIAGWPKEKGRDGERTPIQWNRSVNAGFTSGTPWLTTPKADLTDTVQGESTQPGSILSWYRRLLAFRRESPVMRSGSQQLINEDEKNVLAWVRRPDGEASKSKEDAILIACNLSPNKVTLNLRDQLKNSNAKETQLWVRLDSLHPDESTSPKVLEHMTLEPFQVVIGTIR